MTTTISSKGQVVIPLAAREQAGIRAGDDFLVTVQGDEVVLKKIEATPKLRRAQLARGKNGLKVFRCPDGPKITSELARQIEAETL